MEILLWIGGVVLFILILMVSVGLHEAGHMVAAKKLGVRVPEFFIGFGRKLWSFKKGETEYGIRALPLGGYVRLVDDKTEGDGPEREMLSNVAPWKRQIIFAAGPAVNIILGFAIIFSALLIFPYNTPDTSVNTVNICSPKQAVCGANEAGILSGDRLVSIDGKKVAAVEDISPLLKGKKTANIEMLRNGETVKFDSVVITDNRFGVDLNWKEMNRTPGESASLTVNLVKQSAQTVLAIPSKVPGLVETIFKGAERDPEAPGSVVGAANTYGDVASTNKLDNEDKVRTFVMIAGGLNMSLGLINLIPALPLDGGRMALALLDSIRMRFSKLRKKEYTPTPYKFVKIATLIPATILVGVMALLIVADIVSPVKLF